MKKIKQLSVLMMLVLPCVSFSSEEEIKIEKNSVTYGIVFYASPIKRGETYDFYSGCLGDFINQSVLRDRKTELTQEIYKKIQKPPKYRNEFFKYYNACGSHKFKNKDSLNEEDAKLTVTGYMEDDTGVKSLNDMWMVFFDTHVLKKCMEQNFGIKIEKNKKRISILHEETSNYFEDLSMEETDKSPPLHRRANLGTN